MVVRVTESEVQMILADLLDRVAAGERIIIDSQGQPKAVLISPQDFQILENSVIREAQPSYFVEPTIDKREPITEPYLNPNSVEAHVRRMAETGDIKWEGWLGDEVLAALGITREDVLQAIRTPIEEIQERVGRSLKPGETLAAEIIRMREE
jgi:prevent-host-death family protein